MGISKYRVTIFPPGGKGGGLAGWNAIYSDPARRIEAARAQRAFRRDQLPEVMAYYASEGLRLSGHGAWRDALCPFHSDTKPSLRVRVETGAFKCMACGAHGGDILDFHRKRHGLGFVEAARQLGAWRPA